VRTIAEQTRDGMSYVASYYPEGTERKMARTIDVELERTSGNTDFPLVPGNLYHVRGRLSMPAGAATSITLISDSGREAAPVDGTGNFSFERVPPGNYELFSDGHVRSTYYAAWQPLVVEHDTDINPEMLPCTGIYLDIAPDLRRQMLDKQLTVKTRRRDPDKEGPEIAVKFPRTAEIAPGNWEIAVDAGSEGYAKEITVGGHRAEPRSKDSAEGWNLAHIGGGESPMRITMSSRVASVSGRVFDKPNEPAPYAPVFLETMNLEPPDPPIVRQARASPDGAFEFKGLPPGRYRVIASFDLDASDRAAMENARPTEISLAEGQNAPQELALYRK
jgi:hypothetical protein